MPSLKKNILYNVLLSILRMIFPVITTPYISRILGAENIGFVSFVNSYAGYFVLFAALGINLYGVREIAKHKNDMKKVSEIFSGMFKMLFFSTLVVSAVYISTVFLVPEYRKETTVFLLAGISLYMVPISIDWFFQGLEDFRIITLRSFAVQCIMFIGIFIFIKERDDVVPYILLLVFANTAANIWNFFYAWKKGLRLVWKNTNVKKHVKPMFVLFISTIAINLFTAIYTLMLGWFSSYEQVGFFASANKVIMIVLIAIASVNTALFPNLSFKNRHDKTDSRTEFLQRVLDFFLFIIIPVSAGFFLISPRFVPLFFGKDFYGSIVPMQILSLKIIVVTVNSLLATNILLVNGFENKFSLVVIFTGLFSVILNLFLIPKFGAIGAATAGVASESFEIFLNLYFVYKFTKVRLKWKSIFSACLCTLPFFILYRIFDKTIENSLWFLAVFVPLCAFLYFILQNFIVKNYIIKQIKEMMINKLKI